MRVFEKAEQITDRNKYKSLAVTGLKKVAGAPEKFFYVEKFKFADKEAPLLLVGEVSKDILADLKEHIKSPLVEGKVKRAAATELKFAPAKGTLQTAKVDLVIKSVGAKDTSTIGKLDEDEEQVGRDKDAREAELEKLRTQNARPGFQNRREDAKSAVDNMLQSTGRSADATTRDAARDKMSGKILSDMENSVNARNKVLSPDKPEAHHVTAHGPESDQVSRLVTGHRNDEILAEKAKGPLPTGVKLTGNPSLGDKTVPGFDKVGEGASNISGAFTSNTAMLHAIEEAYSQMAQLDSYIASAEKAAAKAEYQKAMEHPDAKNSLARMQVARKVIASLQAELKKPSPPPDRVKYAQKMIGELQAGLKVDYKKLQDTVKAVQAKATLAPEFGVGNERMARTVQPGTTGTKAFAPEGIGTGYEIDTAQGKQSSGTDVAKDGKTKEQVMQERYDKIKTTTGQQTAKVVMDPAFVPDGKGGKRRAGWDVQTAYPVNDKANQPINQPGGAEAYVGLVKDIRTKEVEVTKSREDEKNARQAYEQAKKKREQAEAGVKAKTEKAKPAQEGALKKAKDALVLATGTDKEDAAKAQVAKMQSALDGTLAAIAKAENDIKELAKDENTLKGPWEAAKLKLDKQVKELEDLQAKKE